MGKMLTRIGKMFTTGGILMGLALAQPPAIQAEPITLTGHYFFIDTNTDSFDFAGPGLRVATAFPPPWMQIPRQFFTDSCNRGGTIDMCRPGEVFDNTFRTPGEVSLGPATAIVGGINYGEVNLLGSLEFVTTPMPAPDPGGTFQWVSSPFVMSGRLRALDGQGVELFNQSIAGQGAAASIWYRFRQENPDQVYPEDGKVIYSFDDVTPTPEPASMILIGTGLAGLLATRRRRLREE